MTGVDRLRPEFVEHMPEHLEDGVLYVSIPFATAIHRCCCGCGREVVTPFKPTDWTLIYDGETVSLDPSIGNWSFDCQSHYWIERGEVRWAPRLSRERIALVRRADRAAKGAYYGSPGEGPVGQPATEVGFLARLKQRLMSFRRPSV